VIYTSGSTGQPKGVMIEHRAIVNRLLWMQDAYGLTPSDRVLQKTPFSFDVSVWEFFWPLLAGASLIIARPEGHRDSSYLTEVVAREQITTLHFVPSMLQAFLDHPDAPGCTSLRRVICSGEALSADLQEYSFRRLPHIELHNLYGPTEAAVDVTAWACQRDERRSSVSIGYPVANTRTYVLDGRLQPVPIGVAGELHIGGVQLARGYLNRPTLTDERFIADPFDESGTERIYKTGDLARYRADGAIEYLGRLDDQVKIRGFRIELGEIESVLREHARVREASVLVRAETPGDQRLVAYIVPHESPGPESAELRRWVAERLPDFMVPALVVTLEEMPLSPNGKLDRRKLPAPIWAANEQAYVAPRSSSEECLAGIWTSVLGIDRPGIHDNFFELGGHSLLATQVVSRIRDALQVDVSLSTIFETPTIAGLAEILARPASVHATLDRAAEPMLAPVSRDRHRRMLSAVIQADQMPAARIRIEGGRA
jgi:acyl-coenzyme A synthetase/AMP-(fatty) acid ligase